MLGAAPPEVQVALGLGRGMTLDLGMHSQRPAAGQHMPAAAGKAAARAAAAARRKGRSSTAGHRDGGDPDSDYGPSPTASAGREWSVSGAARGGPREAREAAAQRIHTQQQPAKRSRYSPQDAALQRTTAGQAGQDVGMQALGVRGWGGGMPMEVGRSAGAPRRLQQEQEQGGAAGGGKAALAHGGGGSLGGLQSAMQCLAMEAGMGEAADCLMQVCAH